MIHSNKMIVSFLLLLGLGACKKEWLDAKSNKSLDVPGTVEDFQAVLDNTGIMNTRIQILTELSADNYYLLPSNLSVLGIIENNTYKWVPDILAGTTTPDWSRAYQRIFYANVALEGINKIDAGNPASANWKNVKGSALFYRSYSLYLLTDEFATVYNTATAGTDLGVPMRLSSDLTAKSTRATVKQNYDQLISDFTEAASLLPVNSLYRTRPSKAVAFAMLAQVYLNMADYGKALLYADSALQLKNQLINFSELNVNASFPLSSTNSEILFYTDVSSTTFGAAYAKADTVLYQSYDINDLRRTIFYTGTSKRFRGHYTGSTSLFCGIATDEIYLMRAEAYARTGNATKAMDDLNTLLASRWSGAYTPQTATDAADALKKVLAERRKELAFRAGRRWSDLKRFNRDGANITLQRLIDSEILTLLPNDKRYVMPIPDIEIRESGIAQNPR